MDCKVSSYLFLCLGRLFSSLEARLKLRDFRSVITLELLLAGAQLVERLVGLATALVQFADSLCRLLETCSEALLDLDQTGIFLQKLLAIVSLNLGQQRRPGDSP